MPDFSWLEQIQMHLFIYLLQSALTASLSGNKSILFIMKRIVSILIITYITLAAYGQAEKQLVPTDLKQLTVVTEPTTLHKGFFRAGTALSYSVVDKYFTNDKKKEYFLQSAWATNSGFNFIFQYGITDRFQVEAALPLSINIRQSDSRIYVPSADTTVEYSFTLKSKGLGDCYFTIKYQILNEQTSNTSLTGSLDVTVPSGEKNPTDNKGETDYNPPLGNGCFATTAGLRYRKIQYPYSFAGYLYYTYQFPGSKIMDPSDTQETEFKDGNHLDAGVSISLHLNEWIALTNDANLYFRSRDEINGEIPDDAIAPWAVSYEPRLVFQVKRFRISEAVRIPIYGKGVGADPIYVLIAQYVF
jgi:hypothetical protein